MIQKTNHHRKICLQTVIKDSVSLNSRLPSCDANLLYVQRRPMLLCVTTVSFGGQRTDQNIRFILLAVHNKVLTNKFLCLWPKSVFCQHPWNLVSSPVSFEEGENLRPFTVFTVTSVSFPFILRILVLRNTVDNRIRKFHNYLLALSHLTHTTISE